MTKNLTVEQEAMLSTYRDKWLKIGLSTEPVNLPKAVEAAKLAYEIAGLDVPKKYEIYDSPSEAITEMKVRYGLDISVHDFVFGAHDAPWLSFYNYLSEVISIGACKKAQGLMELAENAGWCLFFDDLVVFTHRPSNIKFDDQQRTHCEDDYAIKYRDGTGVTVWHGIAVPEEWIFNKSTITPDVMLHHPNTEQRRAACEIVGWATVLEHLDAKLIDKDPDETVGSLMEVDLPDIGTERFLVALDPNVKKIVGLPVPPEMKTALEANSWTYGIDSVDFKPDFRV